MTNDYDPNYVYKPLRFIVGVKAIITNKESKVLLLLRSQKTSMGGKWGLPGGAVEKGEDVSDSIRREIKEETKLEVENIKLLNASTREHNSEPALILIFSCNTNQNEVTLNWEHDDFVWVAKGELEKYDTTPDAKSFINNFFELGV